MLTWGISAGSHDAAVTVLKDDNIAFAAHSERYSGKKNDSHISADLLRDALRHGVPDRIVWHEKPWIKMSRQLYAGQWRDLSDTWPRTHLGKHAIHAPIHTVRHHLSHAAGGYYTSGVDSAAVLVLDAMGEWDTVSAWQGLGTTLTQLAGDQYPNSLGLFYSAMTQRCGFKPNEEEYIMMGLAAHGDANRYRYVMLAELITITDTWPFYRCRFNHHRGFTNWRPEITDVADLAAAAQQIYTDIVKLLCRWLYKTTKAGNLVLAGGCALNCVTNAAIDKQGYWRNIWIMPNPGDAGNSLGAALAAHCNPVRWTGPYLGHDIPGKYPTANLLYELQKGRIVGVANGRAEFGPRALGNRSLLADPRIPNIKDQLNAVKQREEFRPFAPVVLAEHADQFFATRGLDLRYMQYTVQCLQPSVYPGIVHVDGTSRVQTVTKRDHPGLHDLLTRWYARTGCPMLVNTSLNIKGQPLVNTERDAEDFVRTYRIPVFCRE